MQLINIAYTLKNLLIYEVSFYFIIILGHCYKEIIYHFSYRVCLIIIILYD